MTPLETILTGLLGLWSVAHLIAVVRNGRNAGGGWSPEDRNAIEEAFRRLQLEWSDTVDKLTAWERRDRRRAYLASQASSPPSVSKFRSARMRERAAAREAAASVES